VSIGVAATATGFAALIWWSSKSQRKEVRRVAVLGAGIGGMGAAHALCASGISVEVFEEREEAGGNAKTFKWPDGAVSGLSVLAWPSLYFRNYDALLRQLQLKSTKVRLPFYIRREDGKSFSHDSQLELSQIYAEDMRRWDRLVSFVRRVNRFFAWSDTRSLYHLSLLNPMNVFPLRLLVRLFGISSGFWQEIFTPLHITTFLTTHLHTLPAVIVPIIDETVPLNSIPELTTWIGSSKEVFDGIIREAGPLLQVRTGNKIERVEQAPDGTWTVHVRKTTPGSSLETYRGFDRLVFATSAVHAAQALPKNLDWLVPRMLFGSVRYCDQSCSTFVKGIIHSDATVLPADVREKLLGGFANYIEKVGTDASGCSEFENTFCVSAWYPSVQPAAAKAAGYDTRPRFVSYGLRHPELIKDKVGEVANISNHPELTPKFLLTSILMRLFQGRRGVYFCGSMATPGNGHDLSLCSGFAVATAMGAQYPFSYEDDAAADFRRLRKVLGL
jgi:predicted NAD/FAD-binding protein